jgi:hypothetical protein
MATSMTIDRTSIRQIAAAMAIVMAMATLPSVGVIVIADRSGPCISLDICHPLQSLETASGTALVARPALPAIGAEILAHETLAQFVPVLKDKLAEDPDSPPPKLLS